MWTKRKFVFCGVFGGIGFAIQTILAFTVTIVAGTGAGAPVVYFMWPLLMILFRQIVAAKGAIILMGAIVAILSIPTPAFGPPGFIPKALPIFVGSLAIELVFSALSKKPAIASLTSGAIGAITSVPLFIQILIWFSMPGAERFLELALFFVILGVVEAAIGALAGEKIYEKIRDRPSIRRIQQD